MKKLLLKRLLCIPLGAFAFCVTLYARHHPDWTERVSSRSVYPVLSAVVGFLPSLAGFSVTEWLAALFLLFCLWYAGYSVRSIIVRKGGRGMAAYRGAAGAAALVCAVYFAFTALCGLNYHRRTFAAHAGYGAEPFGVAELERLCASLAGELGRVRQRLEGDAGLYSPGPGDFRYYARRSVLAIEALAERYPALGKPLYSAPKPMVLSGLMSSAGIGGVFFPFTLESNINDDAPFFTIPSTMAHELAHQCGFMREDEANFIAYLACKRPEEPLVLYSGLFLAYNHSAAALRGASPGRAAEIAAGLPPEVQHDIALYRQFWARHDGIVSEVSNAANDLYLKANSQADGVYSYGRMVDLLLAEQRETR